MNYSDSELVRKSKHGSYEAFAQLVRRYVNIVFAYALGKTKDVHYSEDIAQEVLVKAWLHLPQLNNEKKFSFWLLTIAKNECNDWLRKQARIKEEVLEKEFPVNEDPFVKLEWKEAFSEALETLGEKYQMVTVLHFLSGYTAKEISNFLSLSQSAVESRIRRAKKQLQKELLNDMTDAYFEKKIGKEIEEEVMWRIVPRIATIEIPVSNIKQSVAWYSKYLGTKASFTDEKTAMLQLQGGSRVGVPMLYLVQTEDGKRLHFQNTNTGVSHSIIDFYLEDLERFHSFLKKEKIKVTELNYFPNSTRGGFGFEDPDGNLLSACNVTFSGQE